MPVTQTESAGQMITLTVPAENSGFAAKLNSLPWIKDAQVTANENTGNGAASIMYTIVLPDATEEQVKNYGKQLESLGGISTIKIHPMNYDVKRPLYSAALDHFFSIKIDATGMNDDELKQNVEKHLTKHGINMKFNVKTDAEGRRRISLEHPEGSNINEPRNVQLDINDENGKEKLRIVTKKGDPEKFKNKSDNEIREMIKNEHPDLKDEDIKITRDGDKVQVKVEAERNMK
jgi:hypothetical protein